MRHGACTRAPASTMTGPSRVSRTAPGSMTAPLGHAEAALGPGGELPGATRRPGTSPPSARSRSPFFSMRSHTDRRSVPSRLIAGQSGHRPSPSAAGKAIPSGIQTPTGSASAVVSRVGRSKATCPGVTCEPAGQHEPVPLAPNRLRAQAPGGSRLFEARECASGQVAFTPQSPDPFRPCAQRFGTEEELAGRAGQREGAPVPGHPVVEEEEAGGHQPGGESGSRPSRCGGSPRRYSFSRGGLGAGHDQG